MIRVGNIMNFKIDNLQYCNWSREIFEFNRAAGLDAVHVTIVYHEDYDELLVEIKKWEKLFSDNSDLIFQGKDYNDIEKANLEKKTAIFFGFQNCSPIEDDINLAKALIRGTCYDCTEDLCNRSFRVAAHHLSAAVWMSLFLSLLVRKCCA